MIINIYLMSNEKTYIVIEAENAQSLENSMNILSEKGYVPYKIIPKRHTSLSPDCSRAKVTSYKWVAIMVKKEYAKEHELLQSIIH